MASRFKDSTHTSVREQRLTSSESKVTMTGRGG